METELIYQSFDEHSESQYPMCDQELTIEDNATWLNQFVIHPNDPTDVAPVTSPTYDINMPTLYPSATNESQLSKHTHNVSTVKTNSYLQSGSYLIQLWRSLPTRNSPKSLTPSKRGPANVFRPYDLPDTPRRPTILN